MARIKRVLACILLLTCSLGAGAFVVPNRIGQEFHFTRLSVKDGLSQTTVNAIVQDAHGFMWFGTHDGVNRYDGYEFVTYRGFPAQASGGAGRIVLALLAESSGILWIGTEAGGLIRFDPANDSYAHYSHDPDDPDTPRSNTVGSIWRDEDGTLWLGTAGGWLTRFDPRSGTFRNFQLPQVGKEGHSRSLVSNVFRDREGVLWMNYGNRGLARFDERTERFSLYSHDPENPGSIGAGDVNDIREDRAGNLWMCLSEGGLNLLDRKTGRFVRFAHDPGDPFSISHNNCNRIFQDGAGTYWVATERGLNVFDPTTGRFFRYHQDPANPNSLSDDNVRSIYQDRSGTLWFGTHGAGVNRMDPGALQFDHYRRQASNPNSISSSYVYAVLEDRNGILWVGGDDGVLNRVDRANQTVTHYAPDRNDPRALNVSQSISAMHEDSAGTLWIGTFSGGLHSLDRDTGVFKRYSHDPKDASSISSDFVTAIEEDEAGGMWVGTADGGLNRFDRKTERFERVKLVADKAGGSIPVVVRDIHVDRTGVLWLTSWEEGLTRFDPRTGEVTTYRHRSDDANSLASDSTFMVHENLDGTFWVATRSGLDLFDPRSGRFKHYTVKDGLLNDVVYAIAEDRNGAIWISTNQGLARIEPRTETITNYTAGDGLQGEEFNQLAVFRGKDGEIFFGGTNGLTAFRPENIRDNPYVPPVVLTDLQLFTQSVSPGKGSILQKPIWATHEISLEPDQDFVSIAFSALSYAAPEDNRYRYKLEGLDKDWYEVDASRRLATYTSLPPGQYVFRVQGSNDDGVWNEAGASLALTVVPPWWNTATFRIAVVVLCVGLIAMVFIVQRRGALRRQRLLEDLVADRTRELSIAKETAESANRTKSAFLASMSHELRTPLNAILGYAQILGRERLEDRQVKTGLKTIQQAGEHLLNLINNILDLAKIEAGKVQMERSVVNLRSFLVQVGDLMRVKAAEKGLAFEEDLGGVPSTGAYTDEARLRQVLLNLLGNAIKFTERGAVTLRVKRIHGNGTVTLRFEVADTGIGIPQNQLELIFKPFEQVEGVSQRHGGTGLGLAISAQLVRQFGGEIQVESTVGKGSRFWFDIAFERAADSECVKGEPDWAMPLGYDGPARRVLVVDDVQTNREFLMSLLVPLGFEVIEAQDGLEAISMATASRPDVVLLDVMMPVMNGLDACREMRRLDLTRHIPIVALSASSSNANEAGALEAGADAFLSKPLEVGELIKLLGELLALQWRFVESGGDKAKTTEAPAAPMVLPPLDQLEALLAIANTGSMREVKKQASLILQEDERYRPFAERLQGLADGFRSIEIVRFVKEAIDRRTALDQGRVDVVRDE